MRLTLALMTSAMLASAVSAQSIAPELQSRGSVLSHAPVIAVAPAIAAPTPIATVSVDRAELAQHDVDTPKPLTLGLGAGTSTDAPGVNAGDDRLQSSRRPRAVADRLEAKRAYGRAEAQPLQRYRPVASGVRDFGRFWPPVF